MDLRSAHKTPEKPPARLRLSLTRSLVSEDEDQLDEDCGQESGPGQAHRKGKVQFKCLNSQPPSPAREDWEGEDEDEDNLDSEDNGEDEDHESFKSGGDIGTVELSDAWRGSSVQSLPFSLLSPSGQEKTDEWCSAIGSDEVLASEMSDNDVWRPVIGPGEVTVTDITLNSLTVTFRESTMAKDFFREWGLRV